MFTQSRVLTNLVGLLLFCCFLNEMVRLEKRWNANDNPPCCKHRSHLYRISPAAVAYGIGAQMVAFPDPEGLGGGG